MKLLFLHTRTGNDLEQARAQARQRRGQPVNVQIVRNLVCRPMTSHDNEGTFPADVVLFFTMDRPEAIAYLPRSLQHRVAQTHDILPQLSQLSKTQLGMFAGYGHVSFTESELGDENVDDEDEEEESGSGNDEGTTTDNEEETNKPHPCKKKMSTAEMKKMLRTYFRCKFRRGKDCDKYITTRERTLPRCHPASTTHSRTTRSEHTNHDMSESMLLPSPTLSSQETSPRLGLGPSTRSAQPCSSGTVRLHTLRWALLLVAISLVSFVLGSMATTVCHRRKQRSLRHAKPADLKTVHHV